MYVLQFKKKNSSACDTNYNNMYYEYLTLIVHGKAECRVGEGRIKTTKFVFSTVVYKRKTYVLQR